MVELIAEVGSVHDGSFGNALQLIDAAATCGAAAVKFQTHIAAAETLADAPAPSFFQGEPRYEYFERTSFSTDQWRALSARADERGIGFLSSPFSVEAVDLLEDIGVGAWKVPSGEVTNLPLLERLASTGQPVLLSSGMSSWGELDKAVELLAGGGPVTVLQCSSAYPCPPERVGLNVLRELQQRYGLPVGLSDHTLGPVAAIAAVVLGATVIEKHFTFSRLMYGSDARHSTEPAELTALAEQLRALDLMLTTTVDKDDIAPYAEMKRVFQKSIVTAVPVPAGTVLTRDHLTIKKPGTGLPPGRLPAVVGRTTARDLMADHLLDEADLQ